MPQGKNDRHDTPEAALDPTAVRPAGYAQGIEATRRTLSSRPPPAIIERTPRPRRTAPGPSPDRTPRVQTPSISRSPVTWSFFLKEAQRPGAERTIADKYDLRGLAPDYLARLRQQMQEPDEVLRRVNEAQLREEWLT